MSNLPAVHDQGAAVARRAHEEELGRGLVRLRTEAEFLAGSQLLAASYRLDRDRRPRPKEEVMADVMVVLIDARNRGLPTSLSTINKYAVINGAAIPMGQLLIGLVARHGHDLWIEERSDDRAVVILHNARTGRDHRVEYTMAEAQRSASYKKSVSLGADKSVWLSHPADMLVWRAVNRAVRFGAPDIAAGFGIPEEFDDVAPGLPVDMDYEMADVEGLDQPAPPAAQVGDRRVARLRRQIDALPDEARQQLGTAWKAAGIPKIDHEYFHGFIGAAEDLVDEVTAAVFAQAPGADTVDGGAAGDLKEPEETVAARDNARPTIDRIAGDRARPLAQQIAIQAQSAGVDHHHVILAVTDGEKRSAKDVNNEEGELVLLAIRDLADGKLALVERDGAWRLDRPTYRPGEEPFE